MRTISISGWCSNRRKISAPAKPDPPRSVAFCMLESSRLSFGQPNRDPQGAHLGRRALSLVPGKAVQEVPPVPIGAFAVAEHREEVDLPVQAVLVLLLAVIDVADQLGQRVLFCKAPVEREHDRRA